MQLAFFLYSDIAQVRAAAKILQQLYRAFVDAGASLAEINPLVTTPDGAVVALDAKIGVDDNELERKPAIAALRDASSENPAEVKAREAGLSFIKLDGAVGCCVNGAGLAMATMDEISNAGGFPANFLDVGGGASVERVANAFRILMKGENVSAVLINIFGGIVRCDRVAMGIIEALKTVEVDVPVVVRLQGTNAEEGRAILRNSDLDFIVAETLREAAEKAVAAAGSGSTAEAGS
jgi:succinyl-CoA synthetase beta subunit